MLDRLYEFADIWIYIIFAVGAGIGFMIAPLIGAALGWTAPDRERADYVLRAQSTIAAFTAVLLAFALVQVNNNFGTITGVVEKEASQLELMGRLLERYGGPAADQVRAQFIAYMNSIVADEWSELRDDRSSPKTKKALGILTDAVVALDPRPGRQESLYRELLRSLETVDDLRNQRISSTELNLPAEFWYLILILIVLLIGLNLMIEPVLFNMLPQAAIGVAIALLAALVFTIDTPFKGQTNVTPAPIEKVVTAFTKPD